MGHVGEVIIFTFSYQNLDGSLSHKVKTQYVQISNIIDTSLKHPTSVIPLVLKSCVAIQNNVCLIW